LVNIFLYLNLFTSQKICNHAKQGSPHSAKTGRLDFSLKWHMGKVR